jgi:hypothetical protein
LLLSIGTRFLESFLARLQSMHPTAAIFGGIASSDAPCLLASRQRVTEVESGVVCLAFRGNVPLTALVCREEPKEVAGKLAQVRKGIEVGRVGENGGGAAGAYSLALW